MHELDLSKIYAFVLPSREKATIGATLVGPDDEVKRLEIQTPAYYEVFIVNESDTDMERMELLAGGYHEDIELERRTTELKLLAAKKAAMIDKHTFGDLDFTHWYRLDIWYGVDTPCEAWFQIGRVHALNQSNEHYCDYFEKIGHKIEIGRRSSFGRSSH